jgi:hypothetical protein
MPSAKPSDNTRYFKIAPAFPDPNMVGGSSPGQSEIVLYARSLARWKATFG